MQTALVKFPAKKLASFLAILFVIGIQLAILFAPQIDGDPYRRHERIEAFMAWHQNPSDTTKAALDQERQLEDQHNALVFIPIIVFFVFADIAMLYVYWRYWVRAERPNLVLEPN